MRYWYNHWRTRGTRDDCRHQAALPETRERLSNGPLPNLHSKPRLPLTSRLPHRPAAHMRSMQLAGEPIRQIKPAIGTGLKMPNGAINRGRASQRVKTHHRPPVRSLALPTSIRFGDAGSIA